MTPPQHHLTLTRRRHPLVETAASRRWLWPGRLLGPPYLPPLHPASQRSSSSGSGRDVAALAPMEGTRGVSLVEVAVAALVVVGGRRCLLLLPPLFQWL